MSISSLDIVGTLDRHTDKVKRLCVNHCGTRLASYSLDGNIYVWDLLDMPTVLTTISLGSSVTLYDLCFKRTLNQLLLRIEENGRTFIDLRDLDTQFTVFSIDLHLHSDIPDLVVSFDDKYFCGRGFNQLQIWCASSGVLVSHPLVERYIIAIAAAENMNILASGDDTGKMMIWDFSTGHSTITLQGRDKMIASMVFSSDGLMLASAGSSEITLWDHTNGTIVQSFSWLTPSNYFTAHLVSVMSFFNVVAAAEQHEQTRQLIAVSSAGLMVFDCATGNQLAEWRCSLPASLFIHRQVILM